MSLKLPKPIKDNLQFLCAEVDAQLSYLEEYFKKAPSPALARRILDRHGYAFNLKRRIHSACVEQLTKGKTQALRQLNLRSAELVATDLERLTALARDCISHMDYVEDVTMLRPKTLAGFLKKIRSGVQHCLFAMESKDSQQALILNQLDDQIQRGYKKLHASISEDLKQKKQIEDLTRALFIAQNFKQMGDTLRNMSECMISANLGQAVNFERFHSLQSVLEELNYPEQELQVETIAETRSGSSISGISTSKNSGEEPIAIFKDGIKSKVKEEREGVESWHEIYPGLAPKILSYKKRGQSAAILIEHLPGLTFENILLNEEAALLQESLNKVVATLRAVWKQTQNKKVVCAQYMQQMEKRLPDVYKIHPEFQQSKCQIGELNITSFNQLIKQAQKLEQKLKPPFSVYIHGDFNVDNIIYDPLEKRINFIDLHRSEYMDYVQDVSVFMVSNYRLQILDKPIRKRIMLTAQDFYKLTRRYAKNQQDPSFDLRLALGLARSFATSTRFILDKSLAKRMFLRARYLLELAIAADADNPHTFKLPIQEIFVD